MAVALIVMVILFFIFGGFWIAHKIENHEKRIRHLEKHELEKSDLIERMWKVVVKIVNVLRRYHLWAARNHPPKDKK